jgi:hypothetical protein
MVITPIAQTLKTFRMDSKCAVSVESLRKLDSLTMTAYVSIARTDTVINSDWLGAMLFLFFIVCAYSLVAN